MKTMVKVSAFVIVLVFALAAMMAMADDRLDKIQTAWNAGDSLAVQHDFQGVREQAEIGHLAEQGGKVSNFKELMPGLFAAKVSAPGGDVIMLAEVCPQSTQLCYFGYKKSTTFGGMEYGQAADVATTLYAMNVLGLSEGNPIGLVGAGIIKASFLIGNRYADYQTCVDQRTGFDMAGFGASASNIATMVGVPFPGNIAVLGLAMYARHESALEGAIFECAEFALEA